jgi:hypothetical protein
LLLVFLQRIFLQLPLDTLLDQDLRSLVQNTWPSQPK